MPEGTLRSRLALGLISGTSMDGVDAALVQLSGAIERPRVRLLAFAVTPYPSPVRRRLLCVASGRSTTAGDISQLNFLLGHLFADAALKVCRQADVQPRRVAVIGSHGQTIYHQGDSAWVAGRRVSSTFQIAEPAVVAARTGIPVVADFRPADMAAGGQGAPLVPMVDFLLLRHSRLGTVALNIGGIANVTVIPAGAEPEGVFGFDAGPGNMVIDGLVRHFTRGRRTCDVGGRLASKGRIIGALLAEILRLPFFRRPPPRSAGREQFGEAFMKRYFLRRRSAAFEDLLRTATEVTARSIAAAFDHFIIPRVKVHRVIVSGGGAHNRLLMNRVRELLPQLAVELSHRYGLPVDAKEAMAFAILADRTLHSLTGNLPGVTGAQREVVLGKLVKS